MRRFAAVVFCVLSTASLIAQEKAEEFVAVANWTSPPYWSAQEAPAKDVEQALQGGEALGIHPMGALPSPSLPLTAINPCRIVDTRGATGSFGGPALAANATRTFILPAGPCPGLPFDAGAWSLNFTVIGGPGAFQGGFLTVWPTGSAQPVVSTLNFNANELVANAAVVPAGPSGAIDVFVNAPAHLLIDINGYYSATGSFVNTVNGLTGAVTLAAGSNISITPGGNTLTIANTAPAAWRLTGNAGTTPGTNFVGTTDNQPLEIKVNNQRVFRLEPNATSPRVIGGHADNNALAGVLGATIGGGGGAAGQANVVTDYLGTVGGGRGNRAGNNAGTLFDSGNATVSGGLDNVASGQTSFVGGGQGNIASGQSSTVGGGQGNNASGSVATIPGGNQNTAAGMGSFAAGTFAQANHSGAFVWADTASAFALSSTGINQFIVRANGGIWLGTNNSTSFDIATDFLRTSTGARLTIGGIWTNNSDRDSKENFQEVDEHDVLSRVATLPITRWNYKAEGCEVEHIGPMAQDFAAAFGVGSDDRSIGTLDSSGVALAAIQGLYELVRDQKREIEELRGRLSKMEETSASR